MKMLARVIVICVFCMSWFKPACNAQDSFTKALQWKTGDAIEQMKYSNNTQLSAWSKKFGNSTSVKSDTFQINKIHFSVFYIDPCSGVYSPTIYVFREQKGAWQLIAQSAARLTEALSIAVNRDSKEVMFETKSSVIGTLSFDQLLQQQ